jgi:hypothetical protein
MKGINPAISFVGKETSRGEDRQLSVRIGRYFSDRIVLMTMKQEVCAWPVRETRRTGNSHASN